MIFMIHSLIICLMLAMNKKSSSNVDHSIQIKMKKQQDSEWKQNCTICNYRYFGFIIHHFRDTNCIWYSFPQYCIYPDLLTIDLCMFFWIQSLAYHTFLIWPIDPYHPHPSHIGYILQIQTRAYKLLLTLFPLQSTRLFWYLTNTAPIFHIYSICEMNIYIWAYLQLGFRSPRLKPKVNT